MDAAWGRPGGERSSEAQSADVITEQWTKEDQDRAVAALYRITGRK